MHVLENLINADRGAINGPTAMVARTKFAIWRESENDIKCMGCNTTVKNLTVACNTYTALKASSGLPLVANGSQRVVRGIVDSGANKVMSGDASIFASFTTKPVAVVVADREVPSKGRLGYLKRNSYGLRDAAGLLI